MSKNQRSIGQQCQERGKVSEETYNQVHGHASWIFFMEAEIIALYGETMPYGKVQHTLDICKYSEVSQQFMEVWAVEWTQKNKKQDTIWFKEKWYLRRFFREISFSPDPWCQSPWAMTQEKVYIKQSWSQTGDLCHLYEHQSSHFLGKNISFSFTRLYWKM